MWSILEHSNVHFPSQAEHWGLVYWPGTEPRSRSSTNPILSSQLFSSAWYQKNTISISFSFNFLNWTSFHFLTCGVFQCHFTSDDICEQICDFFRDHCCTHFYRIKSSWEICFTVTVSSTTKYQKQTKAVIKMKRRLVVPEEQLHSNISFLDVATMWGMRCPVI